MISRPALALILLLWLATGVGAQSAEDVEATLLPLQPPSSLSLEKLDLDFDFRKPSREGWVEVHLDARLSNPTPDAQEAQLVLVVPESHVQLRWQGTPVDSQRLVVPYPESGPQTRMVAVQCLHLILLAKDSGHLVADFRLPGLAHQGDQWEYLFRLPERSYWANLGPSLVMVRSGDDLKVDCLGQTLKSMEEAKGWSGALIDPFHPRQIRLLGTRAGRPAVEVVYLAATSVAILGMLIMLPLARPLGRPGAFLVGGGLGVGLALGVRRLVAYRGWLAWTTPAGAWEHNLARLCWLGAGLCASMSIAMAWPARRNKIQAVEREDLDAI